MDIATIQALRQLNNDFYRVAAESFSQSRQTAWPGWCRVADLAENLPKSMNVLDVACGNMRFERFLLERFAGRRMSFLCIDSCAELPEPVEGARFVEQDVIEALIAGKGLELPERAPCDLAVSFGFMHHVPSDGYRTAFIRALVDCVKPGGLVALSFWQFMQDEKLSAKARAITCEAQPVLGLSLEQGDYLLGWNDEEGLYRYCHDYSDEEVESLVSFVSEEAELVESFNADGRNNGLNKYVVLRKR